MSGDSATGAGRDGNFNYQCWSLFAQTFWRASQAWTINAFWCIMRMHSSGRLPCSVGQRDPTKAPSMARMTKEY